ncbi:hypothetical protein ABBQ32_009851 [Trebouxia sp. C0010 RCD-2024]
MDTVPTHSVPAESQSSQHFTRSQTRLHYKAAGVLPFAFQYGVPVVLLGAELAKTGPQGKIYKTMWSDFGGQREAIDLDSETTASREFAEETMGLFGGCGVNGSSVAACSKQMHTQLTQRQHVLKVVHQLKKGEYHMYVAQTPHIDPLMFHLALQQNAETDAVDGAEKTAFAWVTLSDLLAATSTCAKRYFLCAHVHTTGSRRQPVVRGPRRMQLHPCFANSLRLAQDAGLLALVAAANVEPVPTALPVAKNRLEVMSMMTTTVSPLDRNLAACYQSAPATQDGWPTPHSTRTGSKQPQLQSPCQADAGSLRQPGSASRSSVTLPQVSLLSTCCTGCLRRTSQRSYAAQTQHVQLRLCCCLRQHWQGGWSRRHAVLCCQVHCRQLNSSALQATNNRPVEL